jgi:uncharacterized membrane protein
MAHCNRPMLHPPTHLQFITNMALNWFSKCWCCWQSMHTVVKHRGQLRMASDLVLLRQRWEHQRVVQARSISNV